MLQAEDGRYVLGAVTKPQAAKISYQHKKPTLVYTHKILLPFGGIRKWQVTNVWRNTRVLSRGTGGRGGGVERGKCVRFPCVKMDDAHHRASMYSGTSKCVYIFKTTFCGEVAWQFITAQRQAYSTMVRIPNGKRVSE